MSLTVVCFRWKPRDNYRSQFGPETVNTLRRMVGRHYNADHRFVCVTDDPTGLAPDVEVLPLWSDHATVVSPHGSFQPSCYRRLKVFSLEAGEWFGDRFVCLDLDTVIVANIRKLWQRPEDFIMWGDTARRTWYNGSMFMMTAGARKHVWEQFDPDESPRLAKQAGCFGSDQGWISYLLGPKEAKWGTKDGVYSYRVHLGPNRRRLPDNVRMVMFHGTTDPWMPKAQAIPWIKAHYH